MITPEQIALGGRRRLPAAAQRLLRQTRAARLHPAARRAQPLPQRLVGGQLRRQPERRRTHDRLVQAGLPPHRRDRARRADAGRDQRDPGRNRPAAAEPDQRARTRQPAGGAGEHHLEPAARRLAAGQGQLPRQLLARQPLGRLGRHRLLLPVSGLERPQPLLRRQAVEGQAGRDHRVGGLRRRRTALRQTADRLDRQAPAGADARLLPAASAPATPTTSASTRARPTPCA